MTKHNDVSQGGLAQLRQPLSFGPNKGITIDGRVGLAPLAGVSEQVFREIACEEGAKLTTTELASARGIVFSGLEPSLRYVALSASEGPALVQLFGAGAEDFGEAIPKILEYMPEDRPLIGFDINMGCPVEKVVKTGAGSALMQDPEQAAQIVTACRRALDRCGRSDLAVTVKVRLGFAAGSLTAPDVVRACVAGGVDLVAVHGRTRAQMYRGAADWAGIRATVDAVRACSDVVPVLGNGDVTSGAEAVSMMAETGCDGVLIGRAAEGNPWVFRLDGVAPSMEERIATVRRHGLGLVETLGEALAMREFRKTLMKYVAGVRGAATLRRAASQVASIQDLEDFLCLWNESTPT